MNNKTLNIEADRLLNRTYNQALVDAQELILKRTDQRTKLLTNGWPFLEQALGNKFERLYKMRERLLRHNDQDYKLVGALEQLKIK